MVKAEVIRRRLAKLDEYLRILQKMKKHSFDEFTTKPEIYGSGERFLQLAIEATLDIGNRLIADLNLGEVNWYRDIPILMEKSGYVDSQLKEQWIRMIGFRNTLVHDYLEIDRKIVYTILQNNLDDIVKLKKIFAQFL
ncbi:MAG TPA: DUF86 domain-containing protein [Candidatus Moranbacteria bacterium]|nr:DUF86 domain-containing protein [Candidatus Moranbacteria bacterium]